jgi:hypothetical protein
MEPSKEPETPNSAEQREPEKKRRFQIVKLEDRVAPGKGVTANPGHCKGGGGSFSDTSSGSSGSAF